MIVSHQLPYTFIYYKNTDNTGTQVYFPFNLTCMSAEEPVVGFVFQPGPNAALSSHKHFSLKSPTEEKVHTVLPWTIFVLELLPSDAINVDFLRGRIKSQNPPSEKETESANFQELLSGHGRRQTLRELFFYFKKSNIIIAYREKKSCLCTSTQCRFTEGPTEVVISSWGRGTSHLGTFRRVCEDVSLLSLGRRIFTKARWL